MYCERKAVSFWWLTGFVIIMFFGVSFLYVPIWILVCYWLISDQSGHLFPCLVLRIPLACQSQVCECNTSEWWSNVGRVRAKREGCLYVCLVSKSCSLLHFFVMQEANKQSNHHNTASDHGLNKKHTGWKVNQKRNTGSCYICKACTVCPSFYHSVPCGIR